MSSIADPQLLTEVYGLIAVLWCCPPESDAEFEKMKESARNTAAKLDELDRTSAAKLVKFIDEHRVSEEQYIDLFELNPRCALYLGSHNYEEPTTCANAAVSDRNEYMIELAAIYRHFGQVPNGVELPDYLPLMVDFLSLTAGQRDDAVRKKFINEYFVPLLAPLRARLQELETPYLHLLEALESVLELELVEVVHIQPAFAGAKE